jgi:hypothetical protein
MTANKSKGLGSGSGYLGGARRKGAALPTPASTGSENGAGHVAKVYVLPHLDAKLQRDFPVVERRMGRRSSLAPRG